MGELKSKMVNHVRSAQKWLNRAEQAFESEKDLRGKLDLMLAQAEMQHLHESAIKGKSVSLIKQTVAFCVAAVLFSSGIGGAYFYFHHNAFQPQNSIQVAERQLPLPAASESPAVLESGVSSLPAATSSIVGTPASTAAVLSTSPAAAAPAPKEESARVLGNSAAVDRETAVSQVVRPEEMQKLIRAAGKSLRGQ